MSELLARFVAAFQRGIEGEVAALQAGTAVAERPLTRGEELGGLRYAFDVADPPAVGTPCTLRAPRGDQRVTIEAVRESRITLAAREAIDVAAAPLTLQVAPWFLYERMITALATITPEAHAVTTALALFGKHPPTRATTALRLDHAALDPSQRAAVQLCSDSSLAFVWGPPGTGKTVTLTHVLEELLAQGKRILLASTTNAAIDQVLAKLAARAVIPAMIDRGTALRLGRSAAETYGAELADVVARHQGAHGERRERLRARIAEASAAVRFADALLAELAPAVAAQRSLFEAPRGSLRAGALGRVFSPGLAERLAERSADAQVAALTTRRARLERVARLARAAIHALAAADRELEARLVADARLVMCTLTNAYLSPLMAEQRFDVLIAEEAGMATLPPLFYAAALARERVIVVGDPRQLPPIVQAESEAVRRALGRTIFEVTVPAPLGSPLVALLDVQYRMHPAIGALVGALFYDGRLTHRASPAVTDAIAARAPAPGAPIVLVDTRGETTCERAPQGSRVNPAAAERSAGLALEAVAAGAASVAVITPYAAHAAAVRRRLAASPLGEGVECSTIHRFQGRECDVVILDLVDAAPLRPSALLAEAPNLLNVSISRARGKLVIVADVAYFEAAAPDGVVAALLRAARPA